MDKITLSAWTYRDHVIVVGGSGKAMVHERDPDDALMPGRLLTNDPLASVAEAMLFVDKAMVSAS